MRPKPTPGGPGDTLRSARPSRPVADHPLPNVEGILMGTIINLVIVGLTLGAAIGLPLAIFMPMKDVPQRTALSHSQKLDPISFPFHARSLFR